MIRRIHLATLTVLLCAFMGAPAFAGYDAGQSVPDKLKHIIIPKMSFENARLKDVVDFIKARSKAIDVEDEGVNIVTMCKPETLEQPVTLDFSNIPLGEAIRYVCMGTGLQFRVEKYAVVIGDGSTNMGSNLELRVYHIDAGVLDTGHNKKAGKLGE